MGRISFPRNIGESTKPSTVECRATVVTHWRAAEKALEAGQREDFVASLRSAVLRAHDREEVDIDAVARDARHHAALTFVLRGVPAPGVDTNTWLMMEAAFDAIAAVAPRAGA